MRSTNYLIVGGGIAGFSLAESLDAVGEDYLLIDSDLPGRSTAISAGLINPVTGMRFVLSWNYAELEYEFLSFYQHLEKKYQIDLLIELSLFQRLYLEMDANAWMARCADPYYERYISGLVHVLPFRIRNSEKKVFGKIEKAYRIDIQHFLTVVRNSLESTSRFVDQKFRSHDLQITSKNMIWMDVEIRKAIIFAEGYMIKDNPFFNSLPLMPLKGDCTIFYAKDLKWNFVFKDAYSIIPMGNDYYWCGSNFSLNDLTLVPDAAETLAHDRFLREVLPCAFRITNSFAGIRPAVRDRKPILGRHPKDQRLVVFNGLGTKGSSLAPYCAKMLTNMLLFDAKIPKDISVERFYSYLGDTRDLTGVC